VGDAVFLVFGDKQVVSGVQGLGGVVFELEVVFAAENQYLFIFRRGLTIRNDAFDFQIINLMEHLEDFLV
tara:strand:+ start:105 stop:314 length:210 start_codon:yes stop_codon:yes gene_type:complete